MIPGYWTNETSGILRPAIEAYLDQNKGYQTNKFKQLSLELRQQIATRWKSYADRYGYKIDTTTP